MNEAAKEIFGGYKLSNSHALNYRMDHSIYLKELRPNGHIYLQLKNNNPRQPIDVGHFIWNSHPEELITLLTQRAITGLECFLPFALTISATTNSPNGTIERSLWEAAYNPKPCVVIGLMHKKFPNHKFTKNNRDRTVHILYRCLPMLAGVSQQIPKDLYSDLSRFYDEIRNRLAHGAVVTSNSPEPLLATYELIEQVYIWIETWMPRGIQSGGFKMQWR